MENYRVRRELGKGGYGVVYEAVHISTGRTVALKKTCIRGRGYGIPPSTMREISLLQSLSSPHVVKYVNCDSLALMIYTFVSIILIYFCYFHFVFRILEVFSIVDNEGSTSLIMAMELMDMDLLKFMHNTYGAKAPLPAVLARHFCYQILLGLQHCHVNSVIHRDLKPGNVLVDGIPTGRYQAKIADFGMSRTIGLVNPSYTPRITTRWYRAPEILLGTENYSSAVDIWAVGCIFLQMLLGDVPFQEKSEIEMLLSIFHVLGTPNSTSWPEVQEHHNWHVFPQWAPRVFSDAFEWPQGRIPDHLAIDLIRKMLILDPAQRINTRDALKHPYFDGIRNIY